MEVYRQFSLSWLELQYSILQYSKLLIRFQLQIRKLERFKQVFVNARINNDWTKFVSKKLICREQKKNFVTENFDEKLQKFPALLATLQAVLVYDLRFVSKRSRRISFPTFANFADSISRCQRANVPGSRGEEGWMVGWCMSLVPWGDERRVGRAENVIPWLIRESVKGFPPLFPPLYPLCENTGVSRGNDQSLRATVHRCTPFLTSTNVPPRVSPFDLLATVLLST